MLRLCAQLLIHLGKSRFVRLDPALQIVKDSLLHLDLVLRDLILLVHSVELLKLFPVGIYFIYDDLLITDHFLETLNLGLVHPFLRLYLDVSCSHLGVLMYGICPLSNYFPDKLQASLSVLCEDQPPQSLLIKLVLYFSERRVELRHLKKLLCTSEFPVWHMRVVVDRLNGTSKVNTTDHSILEGVSQKGLLILLLFILIHID